MLLSYLIALGCSLDDEYRGESVRMTLGVDAIGIEHAAMDVATENGWPWLHSSDAEAQ